MRINFFSVSRFSFVALGVGIALALTACIPEPVTPTPGIETQIAAGVAQTLTAMPTQAPTETRPPTLAPTETAPPATDTPAAPPTATVRPTRPVPTAAPPVATDFPDAHYVLDSEDIMGEYAVRVWRNADSPDPELGFDRVLTLDQTDSGSYVVPFFFGFDDHSGTDITGDGVPELIVMTYSGGAHCCTGVSVFSLGDQATPILQSRPGNCGTEFTDLDGDGVLEFATCDDIFAYTYCPFAASPLVKVYMAYDAATGVYAAASPRFADQYTADITNLKAQAESATAGGLGEWDNTTKCGVLPYVLSLLYSGQTDLAWSELARIYTAPDAATFQQDIEQTAGTSLYFALP